MCQIGLIQSGENSSFVGLQNESVILPRKSSKYTEQEQLGLQLTNADQLDMAKPILSAWFKRRKGPPGYVGMPK